LEKNVEEFLNPVSGGQLRSRNKTFDFKKGTLQKARVKVVKQLHG